ICERSGPGYRIVAVPALPALKEPDLFWRELLRYGRARRALQLIVGRCSDDPPGIEGPAVIDRSIEYRAELARLGSDGQSGGDANQGPDGFALRTLEPGAAVLRHLELVRDAATPDAGSSVLPGESERGNAAALLSAGAAELWQAGSGDGVEASVLVCLSSRGAAIHSIGASRLGRTGGASQFLLGMLQRRLRERGVTRLVLGAADESDTWREALFAGCATDRMETSTRYFALAAGWRRKAGSALRLLRENPGSLGRFLFGRVEHFVAYSAPPAQVEAPELHPDLSLRRLTDDDFAAMIQQAPETRVLRDRARVFGADTAYGVFAGGVLAHVSWLVDAERDRHNRIRNVRLRSGEGEIGPCTTLPAFRGRGIYPWVIRSLCGVAAERGLTRVFMITRDSNAASQRGIEKAGLTRCGSIYRLVPTYLSGPGITWRGHRVTLALRRWLGHRDGETRQG
ncbi:MAG TPA: GNAT family N-acetyltransferase, partial [Gemmatimonadales bacterium]